MQTRCHTALCHAGYDVIKYFPGHRGLRHAVNNCGRVPVERCGRIGKRMALAMRAAVLCGLGWWTPPNIVTNDQLAAVLDTSDEWIRSRTGIAQRHVAADGMATSELAVEAGQRALKSAALESVDALILATTTPDRHCPATARQAFVFPPLPGPSIHHWQRMEAGALSSRARGSREHRRLSDTGRTVSDR